MLRGIPMELREQDGGAGIGRNWHSPTQRRLMLFPIVRIARFAPAKLLRSGRGMKPT